MYAIVKTGGKQYRVERGQRLLVERLPDDEGATVALQPVLYRSEEAIFDSDGLSGVKVTAKVLGHVRGEKLRVFKFKPKRGYKRRTGHRQQLTRIEVTDISHGARARGGGPKAAPEKPPAKAAAEKPAAKAGAAEAGTPTRQAAAKAAKASSAKAGAAKAGGAKAGAAKAGGAKAGAAKASAAKAGTAKAGAPKAAGEKAAAKRAPAKPRAKKADAEGEPAKTKQEDPDGS